MKTFKTFSQLREEIDSLFENEESLGTLAARSAMGGKVSGPTRKKIEAKHGKAVADAVHKHAENAYAHDNGYVGPSNRSFHHDFVKKHLGGTGSDHHKDYKAYMHKAGYTKKNTGMDLHHEG